MREPHLRAIGLAAAVVYAAIIISIYARQPQNFVELRGGLAASVGAYTIDRQAFERGLSAFHQDRFDDARAAFARADPAQRDPQTQFFIAYSYYRQGWHRWYSDDELFAKGLEAAERAVALDPDARLMVDDPRLLMHTPREVRAELQEGLRRDASDFNPLRLFGERK